MSVCKLLLDLGASRLKAALFDPARQDIIAQADISAPTPVLGAAGEVEVEPLAHLNKITALLSRLPADGLATIDAAFVCSEMHGFILVNEVGEPLTPYVSWRDERALQGPDPLFARLHEAWAARFRASTGMRLRPGTPFVTVAQLAATAGLSDKARFLSLPEWIASACGASEGTVHESMAAGSGFYDLNAGAWNEELIGLAGLAGSAAFSRVVRDPTVSLGRLTIGSLDVPLFGGVGDMQCALLGSGLEQGEVCLNLGTGSQAALLADGTAQPPVEIRPYFDGRRLHALTHLPAGRALNVFAGLVDSIAKAGEGRSGLIWDALFQVSPKEAETSPLKVDLNVFKAAWRYDGGGGVTGVCEGAFDLPALAAGLVKGFVDQYVEAIALLDSNHSIKRFVLAGGLAARIPAAAGMLTRRLGVSARFSGSKEETLRGLSLLAGAAERARGV